MSDDLYLVIPSLTNQIADVPGIRPYLVVTAVARPNNVPFLWPVRLPNSAITTGDVWATSAQVLIKEAETNWIRKESKPGIQGFMGSRAKADWPEPVFPELSFKEMLEIAIPAERIIKDQSNTVVRRLRGEI